jgi:hypothetical protein
MRQAKRIGLPERNVYIKRIPDGLAVACVAGGVGGRIKVVYVRTSEERS